LPCPAGTLAFDVGDVERRFLPGLGGKTDRPRHGSGADGGGGIGDESADPIWFLPYLSGERTPHNNPHAKGVFLA
jgi:hypothetical protein